MDVQSDVGIADADVGTFAGAFAELIDDGVLDLIGNELRVAEFLRKDDRIDGKSLFQSDVLAPVNVLDAIIDVVSRQCLEVLDRFQNTYCGV